MTNHDTSTTALPLDTLFIHPDNARQTVPPGDEEAMALSLWTCGLLQPLIGLRDDNGDVGIVAGGRRLRGLQWLAERGWTPSPDKIPCAAINPVPVLLAPDHITALAWAGAENESRAQLHPADEVRHYRRMSEQVMDVASIARACAVTEAHVRRRLKLAALPEDVLDALRADEITLDIAQSLTYAPDHKRCLQALGAVLGRSIHPSNLRHELTEGRIKSTDRRVTFVTLDAYLAAGGDTDEDLFEGGAWLTDSVLLQKMFGEKLTAAAEAELVNGGWKWTKAIDTSFMQWSDTDGLTRTWKEPIDLPEEDQRELEDLSEASETRELTEEEQARWNELEVRAEGDWPEDVRASHGAFLYVDNSGTLTIEGAFAHPEEEATADDTTGDNDETVTKVEAKPLYPANLLDDLRAIRLHALQKKLAGQTNLALDLLAFSLDPTRSTFKRPLAVDLPYQRNLPDKDDGFTPDARLTVDGVPNYHEDVAAEFAAFQAKGKRERNRMLTEALARQLTASPDREPFLAMLAAALKPDVRAIWTPTAAFFKRMGSADHLVGLYAELTGFDRDSAEIKAVAKETKTGIAKALDGLFNDLSVRETLGLSRDQNKIIDEWLPEALRFEEVVE